MKEKYIRCYKCGNYIESKELAEHYKSGCCE